MGHGEWAQAEPQTHPRSHGNELLIDPEWVRKWRTKIDKDLRIHQEVCDKRYPNRWGARVRIDTRWNLELFQQLLQEYEDREVVEWLKYGRPTGRLPTLPPPHISYTNHKGASEFPQHLDKYIQKEASYGAIMGPYDTIPFNDKVGISPLSTRPKRNSQDKRVILDLSFPIGSVVNDGIPKDTYMGFRVNLTFPKTDQFALRIYQLGPECLMFKVDLSRYFRQIPLDPGDYSLIGYVINGKIYFDKVLPMGMRSAPYIAQRITNAIAYIHRSLKYFLLNYVDDFVGAELQNQAWMAYQALTNLLDSLHVETAQDKIVPPTTRLEFLGIMFDARAMTMEVSPDRLKEMKAELATWLNKTGATQKEVESLVGKLQFAAKCVRAGRIFIGRLIKWIRMMNRKDTYPIPVEARKDIAWWARFMQQYNGISLIWLIKEPEPDTVL